MNNSKKLIRIVGVLTLERELEIAKIVLASVIIATASSLSKGKTQLAGFITALPLTSMLALAFSYWQWRDSEKAVEYARSVFWAVPLSLTFFIPFLLAERFSLSFVACFLIGVFFLGLSYFAHHFIVGS